MPKEKKYIELQYNNITQEYLREYCIANKFDLTTNFDGTMQNTADFDFHSTVFFTTSKHNLRMQSVNVYIADINVIGFNLFGKDKDILVLEIQSNKLSMIRDMLASKYNMQDMWPEYKPHITMSYNYNSMIPTIELPVGAAIVGAAINVKKQQC